MKTIFLLSAFLFSFLFSQAQLQTFLKTYGSPRYDAGKSIIQNTDGSYMIAGQTCAVDTNINVYVLKIDTQGRTVWSLDYGSTLLDGGNNVIGTPNGGYLITSHTEGALGTNYPGDCDAYLTELDANGEIIWQETYGDYLDDVPLVSAVTPDGGFIVVGFTQNYGAVDYDVWLFKLDANGYVQWMNVYGGDKINKGRTVLVAPDSGYLVVGQTNSFGNGGNDAYLIKTDQNGNAVWSKTYGGPYDDYAYAARTLADKSGYVFAGQMGNADSTYDAAIWKIDLQGNVIWQQRYGCGGDQYFLSMDVCSDGGFIATGFTSCMGDTAGDMYLVKTDANGKTEWQKNFGNQGYDRGAAVVQTLDGGFAITGETTTMGDPNGDVSFVKTDMFGNLITAGINPVLSKGAARVFPNPASDYVYVVTEADLLSAGPQFSLYDVAGKEVFSTPINSNETMLGVTQLPKGMYVYKISTQGTEAVAGYGKLVIE